MRNHQRHPRSWRSLVLAAGLALAGCSGISMPSCASAVRRLEPPPRRTARSAVDAVPICAGGDRRPLGLHLLPEGRRPGAHRRCRARPVPASLCHRQGTDRRRDDAPGRPAPADRTAAQGQPDGRNYIGPDGEPGGGPQDREIVSFDGRVLVTRYVDPDAANRYGNMVYVRCGPRARLRLLATSGYSRHLAQPEMRDLAQGPGVDPRQGIEPAVVEYLKDPPRRRTSAPFKEMGIAARDLLRRRGTPYDELGLGHANGPILS